MKLNYLTILIIVSAVLAIYSQIVGSMVGYGLLKGVTTCLIISIAYFYSTKGQVKYNRLIIIGLFFCLAGDLFLLDNQYFIAGLGSFLIAHCLFAFAFHSLITSGQRRPFLNYAALIPFMIIGVSYFLFLKSGLGGLTIPVAVYILVIVLMSWKATALYFDDKSQPHLMVFIGALLFLVSDSILAYNKFVEPFSYAGLLILTTYWVAIGLFSTSTCLFKDKGIE